MGKKNEHQNDCSVSKYSDHGEIASDLSKNGSTEELGKDGKCLKEVHCFHNAFIFTEGKKYCFPLTYHGDLWPPLSICCIKMKNKLSKYLWNLRSIPISSDPRLFYNLSQVISNTLKKLKTRGVFKCEVLILNDILGQFSSLHQTEKHHFIKMISKLFSYQNSVKWISAENEFLYESDGLRLLLVLTVGTGKTLEQLHIWNYFKNPGFNSYSHNKEDDNNFSHWKEIAANLMDLGLKTGVWDSILTQLFVGDIPVDFRYFVYYLCLSNLKNLNTLSMKYSMLAGGKGESLCHLGCIQNGRLRILNLLCTPGDLPQKTSQLISNSSWKKALKNCPLLKVNLVMIQIIRLDEVKNILQENMPLQGFHLSCSGIPIQGRETDIWLFDHSIHLMLEYYEKLLKRLGLELWYTPTCIDSSITKLISKCLLLEEFEYRGTFDSIVTVKNICEFYVRKNTKIRKLHLLIREDPCRPDCNKKTLQMMQNAYEGYFINNGVDFLVTTCKI